MEMAGGTRRDGASEVHSLAPRQPGEVDWPARTACAGVFREIGGEGGKTAMYAQELPGPAQ